MAKSVLRQQFEDKIVPELMKELEISNIMAVPKLDKIIVNAGIGKESRNNSGVADEFSEEIAIITGQKPITTKSKKAISNFKLRANTDNGIKVTLRGDKMWDFYYKLVNVVLPREKDFRGVSRRSFDRKGNYSIGFKEHTVFPDIDTSQMVKIRPMQVVICTTAQNDEQGLVLLDKLGMPFRER